MQRAVIGIDVGGGGIRALALNLGTGRSVVAERRSGIRAVAGTNGLAYAIDLDQTWARIGQCVREAVQKAGLEASEVVGLAATSLRHTTIVLDQSGEALLAAPTRDARAAGEAFALAASRGEEMHARCGQWPGPIFSAPRVQWLLAQETTDASRIRSVLCLSDWIAWKLCGELATDASQAGPTALCDFAERSWAGDIAESLGIDVKWLPRIGVSGEALGRIQPEVAAALGVAPDATIAVGGADTQLALAAAGLASATGSAAVLGTTAPLQRVIEGPISDGAARMWTQPHAVAGRWVLESNGGPMGGALEWLGQLLAPDASHPVARVVGEAAGADSGSYGALCDIGAEVMNARERGAPIGEAVISPMAIPPGRDRAMFARSVLEGMACAVRANLEQLDSLAGTLSPELRLCGRMGSQPWIASLIADTLGRPVLRAREASGSALGAALCAAVGAEEAPTLADAAERFAAPDASLVRIEPNVETTARAQEHYSAWRAWHDERAAARGALAGRVIPSLLSAADRTARPVKALVRPRILSTADLDAASRERLSELGDLEYASFRDVMRLLTGTSLIEALEGVQVFITEIDVVDAAALAALPELRAIIACRGDAVNVDVRACTLHGIPVLHAPGRNAESVAELTLAFLLMLARRLPTAQAFLRQPDVGAGDMAKMGQAFRAFRGRELGRSTVGLVGSGAVGRAVARRLSAFGTQILVADPYVPESSVHAMGATPCSLEELLKRSDFVSLHAAVTEETKNLIDADALRRMSSTAALVNTARAALVDETALETALRAGEIAGAALDVFAVEPPGADHPLLQLENVLATPHLAGNTFDVSAYQGRIAADELERLVRGERPAHALNSGALESFDWHTERRAPSAQALATLADEPGPAVSDLQRDAKAKPRAAQARAAASRPPVSALATGMEAVLAAFVEGIAGDEALRGFARDADLTLHFTLSDLGNEFHFSLRNGSVAAALGPPTSEPVEVHLSLRAAVLDGMFRGTLNAVDAAMRGEMSFTGDAAKAMTLQEMQDDLQRLYQAAREIAGDPGPLDALPHPDDASANASTGTETGDPTAQQICSLVDELYRSELITATGGNVSARARPDDDASDAEPEVWITPSQLFKGDLAPEVMVRIGLDGRAADAKMRSPSSEWLMHTAVYRARPDVQAIVHAHAPNATILVNAGIPFLPISTEAAFFGDIPRVPFIMPGSKELGDAVVEALGEGWAVLMQNHGLLVCSRSLRRAADMVEIIDRSAQLILGCRAVGVDPPTLPDDVVATLRTMGDLVA